MKFFFATCVFMLSTQCHGKPADPVVSVYTTSPTTSGASPDVYKQIADNIAERISFPFYKIFGIKKNGTDELQPPPPPPPFPKLKLRKFTTPKPTWENVELLDETPAEVTEPDIKPIGNEIDDKNLKEKDVEEVTESPKKSTTEKKPEKFILYSNYLPVNENFEIKHESMNEISEDTIEVQTEKSTVKDEVETVKPETNKKDKKKEEEEDDDDDDDPFEFDFDDDDDDETEDEGREGGIIYVLELIANFIQLAWGAFVALFRPSQS